MGIAKGTGLQGSLRNQAASGVAWTSVAAVITGGLQAIRLAVLARLLEPGDFGLMTMVWLAIGLAQMYEDMGVSKAVVRSQSATREQLSSLYWLNIMVGAVIFAVLVALSPLIGGFFREPRVVGLVPWTALAFLITPLGQQFQVLLQRDLRFAQLAVVEAASTAMGTIVAVGCAVAGLGTFSLIWGHLTEVSARTLLLGGVGG